MKFEDQIIKDYETRINKKIDTQCNIFYIQPYRNSVPGKYGVIFNGNQIAVCKTLSELGNVVNTMLFFLEGGCTRQHTL